MINLIRVTVLDNQKNVVSVEAMLEVALNVEEVQIDTSPDAVTEKTAKKIAELLCISSMRLFCLYGIPDTFNFDEFSKFTPQLQKTCINMAFVDNISEEYIQKLNAYIDDAVKIGVTEIVPLYIVYPQQEQRWEALTDLQQLCYKKREEMEKN
uniref:Uncharacterized protein n=1 Tax=Panagrolaimus superbus TaxID=310955 RepID=A0A914XUZ9_9BILA